MNKNTMLLIMFILVGIGCYVAMVHAHEKVHQVIYSNYDINSTIKLLAWQPVTTADSPCPTEECILAHHINESISYVLLPMFAFFILFCVIVLIELITIREMIQEENKEDEM